MMSYWGILNYLLTNLKESYIENCSQELCSQMQTTKRIKFKWDFVIDTQKKINLLFLFSNPFSPAVCHWSLRNRYSTDWYRNCCSEIHTEVYMQYRSNSFTNVDKNRSKNSIIFHTIFVVLCWLQSLNFSTPWFLQHLRVFFLFKF